MVKIKKRLLEAWKRGRLGERQMEISDYDKKKKKKKKYTQNWTTYNLAQTNEFVMFQDILIELIDNLVEVRKPLYKKGRSFANFKDMIFCCVMRVYFDKSSRRSTSYFALAKGKDYIERIPHFNTVLSYYKNTQMTSVLKHLIEKSGIPLKELEKDFTVDSSGFSTSLYGRWFSARLGEKIRRKLFKKAHVCSGVKTNIITSVEITEGYFGDSPFFEGLVRATRKNFDMREVSADAAYNSRNNMQVVSDLGAVPYIMFKSNNTGRAKGSLVWKRMFKYFKEHNELFLEHYHKRSNAESVFNMIKRKMGTHLYCRTETAQINELLCKCLAHNICVLISEIFESQAYLDFDNTDSINVRISN
ncbi:MAG: transposase [Nanoarchaeota archaeon]